MTCLPLTMSNGLISPAIGRHHGEAKMAATVSLLLRGRYGCGRWLTTRVWRRANRTRGWSLRSNWHLVCSFVLTCAAHREGLAPAVGKSQGG
jgi:hypothetical protein